MTKKYCEHIECMMQNRPHQHSDEHTFTFSIKELDKSVNILSIGANIMDGRKYLNLAMGYGVFSCEVVSRSNPFPTVEISDDDVEQLRMFLNQQACLNSIQEIGKKND